jgi:diguanylate cyclase (GGDEF)-like protein
MKVQQEMLEAKDFNRTSGLPVIDVDQFKSVNDDFGHAGGDDAVLKALSDTLTRTLRSGDSVGRWGGEEFFLVAGNVGLKELETTAERCRQLIATSSVSFHERRVEVTVSIGATLLEPGRTTDATFEKADNLLYRSKTSGRNRVTVYLQWNVRRQRQSFAVGFLDNPAIACFTPGHDDTSNSV